MTMEMTNQNGVFADIGVIWLGMKLTMQMNMMDMLLDMMIYI